MGFTVADMSLSLLFFMSTQSNIFKVTVGLESGMVSSVLEHEQFINICSHQFICSGNII